MPALTPFCSLLDGSLHKHLICKVSVPCRGDPCQGRHPASPQPVQVAEPGELRHLQSLGGAGQCGAHSPGILLLGHGWQQ